MDRRLLRACEMWNFRNHQTARADLFAAVCTNMEMRCALPKIVSPRAANPNLSRNLRMNGKRGGEDGTMQHIEIGRVIHKNTQSDSVKCYSALGTRSLNRTTGRWQQCANILLKTAAREIMSGQNCCWREHQITSSPFLGHRNYRCDANARVCTAHNSNIYRNEYNNEMRW